MCLVCVQRKYKSLTPATWGAQSSAGADLFPPCCSQASPNLLEPFLLTSPNSGGCLAWTPSSTSMAPQDFSASLSALFFLSLAGWAMSRLTLSCKPETLLYGWPLTLVLPLFSAFPPAPGMAFLASKLCCPSFVPQLAFGIPSCLSAMAPLWEAFPQWLHHSLHVQRSEHSRLISPWRGYRLPRAGAWAALLSPLSPLPRSHHYIYIEF